MLKRINLKLRNVSKILQTNLFILFPIQNKCFTIINKFFLFLSSNYSLFRYTETFCDEKLQCPDSVTIIHTVQQDQCPK